VVDAGEMVAAGNEREQLEAERIGNEYMATGLTPHQRAS
jgi:hypothetical protein